jgi:hypothetical protein
LVYRELWTAGALACAQAFVAPALLPVRFSTMDFSPCSGNGTIDDKLKHKAKS